MPFLQAIFSGVALGSIYALIAFGFSVTYTTTKTFNFGQGEFLALGSLITASCILMISKGQPVGILAPEDVTWTAYLIALLVNLVLMAAIGFALYFAAIRQFLGRAGLSWVMSTLGFGIIVQNLSLAFWGPAPIGLPSPLGDHIISFFGAGVRPQELLVFFTAVALMGVFDWILRRTQLGKAVRAVAQSKSVATLMGINAEAISIGVFVLSSMLAGVAGLLVAPIATASVYIGFALALKAFSAAILGGLSNPRGCMFGGFILGILESVAGMWRAEIREIFVFGLIIAFLYFKPNGLFGVTHGEKV
jgi:branched-chain amino acid transport system permease protein